MAGASWSRWPGGGDIDSVAIAPNGVGFAIEAKTRTYDERKLDLVREKAGWLGRRRRRRLGKGSRVVVDGELDWRERTDQDQNRREAVVVRARQILFEGHVRRCRRAVISEVTVRPTAN